MPFKCDFVDEVCMWNEERDNLVYLPALEYTMLAEELLEYKEAVYSNHRVDQADALADLAVVALGGLFKLCNGDLEDVHLILTAVTAANNTKSSTKNAEGKITKPANFVGPEGMIRRILNDY
jgi:hypothetical protein